jgi:hypothetical protein
MPDALWVWSPLSSQGRGLGGGTGLANTNIPNEMSIRYFSITRKMASYDIHAGDARDSG